MPIRCGDLADDEATLEAYCRQCRRIVRFPGKMLAKVHGREAPLMEIVGRMRCSRDAMPPDIRIVFEQPEAGRAALSRRLGTRRNGDLYRLASSRLRRRAGRGHPAPGT